MKSLASLILLWAGCVCIAAPLGEPEPPLPDGVDREALKKLTRQLGPPVAGSAATPEQIKNMFEQFGHNPEMKRKFEQLMKENPLLLREAQTNPNIQLDPSQREWIDKIARNASISRPPGERPLAPPTSPDEPPRPVDPKDPPKSTEFPFKNKTQPWNKGADKRGQDGTRPSPPQQLPGNRQEQETEEFRKAAQMWEQFVGPLNKTPAVQKVMQQVFTNMGKDKNGNLPPWMRGGAGGNGPNITTRPSWLMRQLNGLGNSSTWDFTGFRSPNLSYGSSHDPSPSMSADSSMFEGLSLDNPKSMLYLLGIIVTVIVLIAVLKRVVPGLRDRTANTPQALHGLGPWPIDPRTIADRAGLVAAFEYLSVLLCGDGARVWNHMTIAEALRDQVPQSAGIAEPLARYYALARYSPNSELFTPEMISEARGYLCQLAGV